MRKDIAKAKKDGDDSKKQLEKKTPKKRQHKETELFSRQTRVNEYFSGSPKKSRNESSLKVSTVNYDRHENTCINAEEERICNSPHDDESEKSIEDEDINYSPRHDLSKCSIEIDTEEEEQELDDEREEEETPDIEEVADIEDETTTVIEAETTEIEVAEEEERREEDESEQEEGEENEGEEEIENEEFSNSDDTASCFWSIYKLDEKRIPGCSVVSNLEQFRDILKKFFLNDDELERKRLKRNKYDTFSCMHFVCISKKKSNIIASQIGRQIGCEKGVECPGDRRSGNLLIYFRMKMSSFSQDTRPESFFLCQGNAFNKIIHLADPVLRTQAAKHFMDGSRIKEIKFLNIAGPNVSTKIICKHTTDILTHRTTYINAYISNITGFITKNCKLDNLVQGKTGKDILMTVGLNFVKIHKMLSYEQIGKINQLFSEIKDDLAGDFPAHIIDALDYIQRVTDRDTKSELERDILKYATDILTGKTNMSDFYLGHRFTEDWSKASDIKLYEKFEAERSAELGCWPSSPSLAEVVKKLKLLFPSSNLLEEYLKQNKIQLDYSRPGGVVRVPIQNYVHGYIKRPEGTYFKVEQKWFLFSSSLYEVLDRNFSFLSNLLLEQKDIKNIFKYPWYSKRMEIVASDPMVRTILGVNETVSDEKLEEIFEILTDDFDLFD